MSTSVLGTPSDVDRLVDEARASLEDLTPTVLFARAARLGHELTALGADHAPSPGAASEMWASRVYAGGTAVQIEHATRGAPALARLVERITLALGTPVRRWSATLLVLPSGATSVVTSRGDTLLFPLRGGPVSLTVDGSLSVLEAGASRVYLPNDTAFQLATAEEALLLRVVVELEPAWRVIGQVLAARLASRGGEWSRSLPGLFLEAESGADARQRLEELLGELVHEVARWRADDVVRQHAGLERATRHAEASSAVRPRGPKRRAERASLYADAEWGISEIARRHEDLHVVTYMRSGTTLMQMILVQLLTDGDVERIGHLYERSPYPAFELRMLGTAARIDALPSPRIFKSHAPFERIYSEEGRFIYVARSAMDVAISSYHHHMDVGEGPIPFDVHVDRFLDDESWFEEVATWWSHRDRPNVLFLTYEDIVADRRAAIMKIAAFCGVDLSQDRERLERAVQRSSFEFMKAHESKLDHFEGLRWLRQQRPRAGFVRRGEVGEGARTLSAGQRRRFAETYQRWLGDTGLRLDGGEHRRA